ncbi:phenylacetate-CoA oxygenase subunit PaaJ [Rugamonas sp. A1-17]|nr:phenylacetate-CoA oxygenase subunit PaaJ [Rugamonas sp. A1-17]
MTTAPAGAAADLTADAGRTADRSADGAASAGAPTAAQVWAWLAEVSDPEIPVISIVDLGIVRDVRLAADGACTVTITPTYSGCPAMQVIAESITNALHAHGLQDVRLQNQLSPAWTTDWMSEEGKAKLKGYGIAPPAQQVIDISGLHAGAAISRRAQPRLTVACPNCGSTHTEITSQFGSTPCKALYKCLDCREPFDYFKCH